MEMEMRRQTAGGQKKSWWCKGRRGSVRWCSIFVLRHSHLLNSLNFTLPPSTYDPPVGDPVVCSIAVSPGLNSLRAIRRHDLLPVPGCARHSPVFHDRGHQNPHLRTRRRRCPRINSKSRHHHHHDLNPYPHHLFIRLLSPSRTALPPTTNPLHHPLLNLRLPPLLHHHISRCSATIPILLRQRLPARKAVNLQPVATGAEAAPRVPVPGQDPDWTDDHSAEKGPRPEELELVDLSVLVILRGWGETVVACFRPK